MKTIREPAKELPLVAECDALVQIPLEKRGK